MFVFPLKYFSSEKRTKHILEILDCFPPVDVDKELSDWIKKQMRMEHENSN